jgi:hypothetical protein
MGAAVGRSRVTGRGYGARRCKQECKTQLGSRPVQSTTSIPPHCTDTRFVIGSMGV